MLFLVVIWAALIFWTYADARRRIDDPMLVACATAASLFPFVGTIVYLIVRPPEFLDDVRLRELEMHAAEARLHQLDWQLCPYCDYEIRADYLRCPNCLRKLKERCNLRQAARAGVEDLPVLRGRDAARAAAAGRRRRRRGRSPTTTSRPCRPRSRATRRGRCSAPGSAA